MGRHVHVVQRVHCSCAAVSHRVSGRAACLRRLYYTRYYTGAVVSGASRQKAGIDVKAAAAAADAATGSLDTTHTCNSRIAGITCP
jgi:hypothetical protein